MLQLKRWTITALCLVLLVAGLGYIKYTQVMAAIAFGESFPEPSETVNAVVTSESPWQPSIQVIGEVRATRTLTLRNELDGMITTVGFGSGALVNEGDLLIQQDISTETAQLEAIEAEIRLAELDVKRFTELLQSNAGSKERLDRANAQLAVNRANARSIKATIARKTMKAPFAGRTALHEWEVGTFLAANTLITTLVGDTSEVWVDFSLPQRQAANAEQGQQVRVADPDGRMFAAPAVVSAVNQQINSTSRSLRVRATLDNREIGLKPGAFVTVHVPSQNEVIAHILPSTALRYDTFGSFVYILEKQADGQYRAKRRAVETLSRDNEQAVISAGLKGGEMVATTGASKLSANMLVYVAGEAQ